MKHLPLGLLGHLKQSPAQILPCPSLRSAVQRGGLPLPRKGTEHGLHTLLQCGQVGMPALFLPEEQLDPAVEGGRLQAWAVGSGPGQAIRRKVQVHVAVGDRPSLPKTAADGAQFQLNVAATLLLPVLDQRRTWIRTFGAKFLAGWTGTLKKGALFDMFGAAAQAHLVEKIPEGHRQKLSEAGGGCQIEPACTGFPGKAHEAVAELVCGPLGAVGGMKAGHHPIQAEIPEFHLRQLSVPPGHRPFQIRAPQRLPMSGQFQTMKVLKVGKKQARALCKSTHCGGRKGSTQLSDRCFHAAFL